MERGTVIGLITNRKSFIGGGGYLVKRKSGFLPQFEGFEFFIYYLTLKYVE